MIDRTGIRTGAVRGRRSGRGRPRPASSVRRNAAGRTRVQGSDSESSATAKPAAIEDRFRRLRGGRSMGELHCRGGVWRGRRARRSDQASPSRGNGRDTPGIVRDRRDGSGNRRQALPPRAGRARAGRLATRDGRAGIGRLGHVSASDARYARDRSSRRPASELTPWPQLAQAGEGARHQAARSTQNAPAKRRFARPDDGFTMTIRTAGGPSTGCSR